jgi:hypothetical protein
MVKNFASRLDSLNHIWLVPFITALLYIICYFYQLGLSSFYKIPGFLINIDTAKIISALFPLGMFVLIGATIVYLLSVTFSLDINNYAERGVLLTQTILTTILIFFTIELIFVTNNPKRYLVAAAVAGFYLILLALIKKFMIRIPVKKSKSSKNSIDEFLESKYPEILALTILIFYLGAFSYVIGRSYPEMWPHNYLVTESNDILINTYGDKVILGRLHKGSLNRFKLEAYRIEKIDSIGHLHTERIYLTSK